MRRNIGLLLPAVFAVLILSWPQRAAAQTRFGVYIGSNGYGYAPYSGYASPYYGQPYNYAPYGAYGSGYGSYYGNDGWRDRDGDRRWRREEEHREHEWREHEHREHEWREHDRHRDRW